MAQEDEIVDAAVNYITRDRPDAAATSVFGDPEGDPAKAAESIKLAQDTGTPASVIYLDPERYKQQQMAGWAAELIRENPHLQSWLTDDEMAAKVAKNDIANLDVASQKMGVLPKAQAIFRYPESLAARIYPVPGADLKEGFGDQPMMSWLDEVAPNIYQTNPAAAAGWTILGYPAEAVMRTIMAGLHAGTRTVTEGVKFSAQDAYHAVTGDQMGAERFGREIAGATEAELMGMSGRGHMAGPAEAGVEGAIGAVGKEARELVQQGRQDLNWAVAQNEFQKIRAWIDGGEEPPPGVSLWLDKIREQQSKEGVKELDDAFKESQKTDTRELSPETYKKLVDQHGVANVEINGEAVRKLYGDQAPAVDDGILGHVIGVGDQLETALATGGDISISMGTLLAEVDPKVFEALRDDIRVKPGALTLNEIKDKVFEPTEQAQKLEVAPTEGAEPAPKAEPDGPLAEPVAQVRHAAGLEPLFAIGDRRLTIKRTDTPSKFAQEQLAKGIIPADEFQILDPSGQKVGWLEAIPMDGGKRVYIDNVGGFESKGYGANGFGNALTRSLITQIKEHYPEVKQIGGYRISGAREKAGTEREVWIDLKQTPYGWDVVENQSDRFNDLVGGAWMRLSKNVEKYIKPTALLNEHERELDRGIREVLERIVPKDLEVSTASALKMFGGEIHGVYSREFIDQVPRIVVALEAHHPIETARHEAIHHLRNYGFLTNDEWASLVRAARDNDWIKKYDIDNRYFDLHISKQLEESIAEAFADWGRGRAVDSRTQAVFQKIRDFIDAIKAKFKEILGKDFSWEETFARIERGEIGRREGDPDAYQRVAKQNFKEMAQRPPQPELPGTRRIEDTEPFKPGAMTPAMTADMQTRYMKQIAERNAADREAATKRAERMQKAQQTQAWKKDRELMRTEVEREINNRPDIAADLFFSRGELYGESLGGRPKIDPESLSPDLAERLTGTDWVKKGGMNADDAANLFGFRNAEQMFDALSAYQAQRPDGIGAKRFRDSIVEKETDRQMELRYGRLQDNIISEARDQAASETQMQLLHEETMFLAEQSKSELPIGPSDMKTWAEESFGKATFADTTSAKWFQTSGKHGRTAEENLLKGKPLEAFKAKQEQYRAMAMAQQALKLEKEKAQFEKMVPKFAKREVKGVDREFTDYIQEMLIGSGIKLKVTMDEVQASKMFHGNTSLKDFVDGGLGHGWGLAGEISPDLQHGVFKDIKTMSVNDFRDLKDAMESLAFVGRRVNQIFSQGRMQDRKAVVDSIIDNLLARPKLDPDKKLSTLHGLLAITKRPEQIIKDLDDHAELGPAFRHLWEPLTVSSAKFLELERELTAKAQKMSSGNKAWIKGLGEKIPNDFFFDPHDGALFNLNRGHLVRIMLNWGNEGNIKKFVEGWAAYDKPTKDQVANFRGRVEKLIQDHARPEDWAYVHDVWDIFAGWQEQLDTVHRNTSGKLPKWVRPDAIKLPDGSTISKGGYFPLIPDKTRLIPGTGFDPLPNVKNGVMQRDYYRPTTTKTHMMDRQVNAKYRVSFLGDMGEVALRMQQVMHDIAYRESLMDVSGVLFDKRLRNAIKERYSPEYLKQLDAWLVRQANHLNYDEIAMGSMNNVLQRVRTNLVAYALPLNLNVVLSPSLGLAKPWEWGPSIWNYKEMKDLAEQHSRVVPHTEYNLDRDFREHIEKLSQKRGWDRLRTEATKKAYWPMIALEQRLRTVTFYNEFNSAKARGLSDYDASQVADSAVRERHGAQTLTDLPTLMASNEGYKMMTVFMGYFNTMDNWARQIPGQIRREEYGKALQTAWGAIIVPAIFGGLMFNKSKEDESYWKIATKAFALQMTQGLPFFREAASMITDGFKPTTPLASVLDSFYQTGRDAYKYTQGKPQGNVIKHITGVAGLGFGVPAMLQAGKTGQFLYDYSRGKQRPRDVMEWLRGLRTGEARLKKGN